MSKINVKSINFIKTLFISCLIGAVGGIIGTLFFLFC